MAEQTFWERPAGIALRWVGFVPIGVLGSMLVNVLALLLFKALGWLSGMPPWAPWIQILSAGYAGWAGVALGAHVAPSVGRRAAAVVLATLISLLGLAAAIFNAQDHHWALLLASIAMACAAIVGCVSVHSESPK
jgi:hypothetical protein